LRGGPRKPPECVITMSARGWKNRPADPGRRPRGTPSATLPGRSKGLRCQHSGVGTSDSQTRNHLPIFPMVIIVCNDSCLLPAEVAFSEMPTQSSRPVLSPTAGSAGPSGWRHACSTFVPPLRWWRFYTSMPEV